MSQDEPAAPRHGDGGLVRVRLDLGYDGTGFSGWAAQPGRRTVEGELSQALTALLRSPAPLRLTVAGRTDAGVHARGQVAHADVAQRSFAELPGRSGRSSEEAALGRLRGILPADIAVHRVSVAKPEFDARFSAIRRRYLYRICDDPASLDPLRRWDTVVLRGPLDLEAMDSASSSLLGLNDFAAFCRRRAGATTVRTLLDYSWRRDGLGVLEASISADAFCHSMVRSLVGAVVAVGEGRREVGWPAERQAARERGVQVMPPHGLSLEEVSYPADERLGIRAEQTRARRAGPDQV
jgi:tRNA pseudouridine38-40 synthase